MTSTDGTTSKETSARVTLPETLDLRAASPLATALIGARGAGVALDASHVTSVGAQCLQVLLAAQLTWRRDGHAFTIESPSDAFLSSLAEAGLPVETLMESELDS
jgi:chemotaxis protein CheX